MDELSILHTYYLKLHDSQCDNACKSSCRSSEFGYHKDELTDETYFFFRFGGYCIADCNRWHEVKAKCVVDLIHEVIDLFDKVPRYNWDTGKYEE